jgi:hypothetical protein
MEENGMSRVRLILALTMALLGANVGSAADLGKVDRSIAKEPTYQTKPKYCLLVFGPEAKTRVWLVQDGDTLYVDRNANGDLTEKDERIAASKQGNKNYRLFEAGDIRDGALTHKGLMVGQSQASADMVGNAKEFARIKAANAEPWIWQVGISAERAAEDKRSLPKAIKYVANGDGLGMLLFADQPQDAPIIHFNGPWSLGLQDRKQRLTAGHESELQIGIGTQGIGPGTFAFVLYPDTIPADAYPIADITFPAKSSGEKPIQRKYVLKQRC